MSPFLWIPSFCSYTSNFFELAVAVAISLFGLSSGATLATVVGVLVEVPIMLIISIVLLVLGIVQIVIGSVSFSISKKRLFLILIGSGVVFFLPMTCTLGKMSSLKRAKVQERTEEMGPLSYSCYKGINEITEFLIEQGADPNLGTISENPLALAIKKNDLYLVKLLIDHGAKERMMLDANGFAKDNTLLMNAVKDNKYEILKFLYDSQIERNVNPQSGHIPFIVSMRHKDFVDFSMELIWMGADIFARDDSGDTALHIAAKEENIEMVEYLLRSGLDVNQQNLLGETPLFLAASDLYSNFSERDDKKKVIELLIENGADITIPDVRGDNYIEHNDNYNSDSDYDRNKLKEMEDYISELIAE